MEFFHGVQHADASGIDGACRAIREGRPYRNEENLFYLGLSKILAPADLMTSLYLNSWGHRNGYGLAHTLMRFYRPEKEKKEDWVRGKYASSRDLEAMIQNGTDKHIRDDVCSSESGSQHDGKIGGGSSSSSGGGSSGSSNGNNGSVGSSTSSSSSSSSIGTKIENERKNHKSSPEFDRIAGFDRDELTKEIAFLAQDKTLNFENLLHAIFVSIVEPELLILTKFPTVTKAFESLPVPSDYDASVHDSLARLMGNKPVEICAQHRLSPLRHDLGKLALPRFFRLKGLDRTIVLNEIVQTVYGGNVADVQSFVELANFHRYKQFTMAAGVFGQIRAIENASPPAPADPVLDRLRYHWTRLQASLVYVELARLLLPRLSKLAVGCVDELNKKELPCMTVFYSRGEYFLATSNGKWRSKSIRILLQRAFLACQD